MNHLLIKYPKIRRGGGESYTTSLASQIFPYRLRGESHDNLFTFLRWTYFSILPAYMDQWRFIRKANCYITRIKSTG